MSNTNSIERENNYNNSNNYNNNNENGNENDILIEEINLIKDLQTPIYDDLQLLNNLSSINFFRNSNYNELIIFFDYFNHILLNYIDKYFDTIKHCLYGILSEKVSDPNIVGVNYKAIINRGVSIIYYKNEFSYNRDKMTDFIYQLAFFKDEVYKIMEFEKRNIDRIMINYYNNNEKNDIYNKCIKYWRHTNNIGIMTYKMETLITPRLSCLDKLYLFLNQKYYNKIDFKLKMFLN